MNLLSRGPGRVRYVSESSESFATKFSSQLLNFIKERQNASLNNLLHIGDELGTTCNKKFQI